MPFPEKRDLYEVLDSESLCLRRRKLHATFNTVLWNEDNAVASSGQEYMTGSLFIKIKASVLCMHFHLYINFPGEALLHRFLRQSKRKCHT